MHGAVLLGKPADEKRRPARDLVIATRMPPPPVEGSYRTPFDAVGDLVAECDFVDPETGKRCGYACQGSRPDVGAAMRAHHQLFHSESTSVVLLNHARQ